MKYLKRKTNTLEYFKMLDVFGFKVGVNRNGVDSIPSFFGSVMSLVLMIIFLCFFFYRFAIMATYGQTSINSAILPRKVSDDYHFNFDDQNFKLAFAFVKQQTFNSIVDPYYFDISV